jgi:pyrroline-5-carboxylate reductase
MSEQTMIAVIGAGKMGEALVSGLLKAGTSPDDLIITERYEERANELAQRYGVKSVSNADAADQADTIVLAVKPQDMDALLAELAPVVTPNHLIVTIAAGITTSAIERRLAAGVAVVRVMPNTPALVGEAMSAVAPGAHASAEHLDRAEALFRPVGRVVRLPESQLDAVTALSGSGPAYVFYLVEAMTDAGILLGLPRAVAHELIVQTVYGAAVMLRETGEHPVALREAVTSPAGTTISAIRELENHGVRAAFLAALEAARDRSRELAGE